MTWLFQDSTILPTEITQETFSKYRYHASGKIQCIRVSEWHTRMYTFLRLHRWIVLVGCGEWLLIVPHHVHTHVQKRSCWHHRHRKPCASVLRIPYSGLGKGEWGEWGQSGKVRKKCCRKEARLKPLSLPGGGSVWPFSLCKEVRGIVRRE